MDNIVISRSADGAGLYFRVVRMDVANLINDGLMDGTSARYTDLDSVSNVCVCMYVHADICFECIMYVHACMHMHQVHRSRIADVWSTRIQCIYVKIYIYAYMHTYIHVY
jgi:hypothetical protein